MRKLPPIAGWSWHGLCQVAEYVGSAGGHVGDQQCPSSS